MRNYFQSIWAHFSAEEKEKMKKEAMEALLTPNPFDRMPSVPKAKKFRPYRPKRGGK